MTVSASPASPGFFFAGGLWRGGPPWRQLAILPRQRAGYCVQSRSGLPLTRHRCYPLLVISLCVFIRCQGWSKAVGFVIVLSVLLILKSISKRNKK
ncbi:hypothetical protein [Vogesella indigofera]|uniref:hypothetical protein n=1 Tax=Vogesella indigofera TaxID=45465 RepID=UPI00234EFA40|nr:hypothetical protein [Vogesella indigofera]MDC7706318.1 hypothetical protein [Vogesella indigofera]